MKPIFLIILGFFLLCGLIFLLIGMSQISAVNTTCQISAVNTTGEISDNESATHFFLQECSGGSFGLDNSGNYSLTLTGVKPDTIYFTDRPSNDIGFVPMERYIEGFDWNPNNPPNAILIIGESKKSDAIIGLKLTYPKYDKDANLLTYTVNIIKTAKFKSDWISHIKISENQSAPEKFGRAILLIDDCGCKSVSPSACYSTCRNSCYKNYWCQPCGGCCAAYIDCNGPFI
jgi:hypothetical protein